MQRLDEARISRRGLLQSTSAATLAGLAVACGRSVASEVSGEPTSLKLPPLLSASESEKNDSPALLPPEKRLGVAVVGLGRLALQEILPAFAASKSCRVTALVTGDPSNKGARVAAQYGVNPKSVLNYDHYDRLSDLQDVHAVYIVLPNSLHAEFTVRAARAGKHVLCEKPMATTVADCQHMIDACAEAKKTLMIAYRMQYEPYNRELIRIARSGALGKLKSLLASNGQAQGDPKQWRLKKALSGGGALPDVGIYCLNAARYVSGEEPIEVQAMQYSTPNDPRFAEVEEQMNFSLRFPSGFTASCFTSYGCHDSKRYRVMGSLGWAELDPAFPYSGQSMRVARKREGSENEDITQPRLEAKNQFALELDHLADCIGHARKPRTPGEEGLQDVRIMTALYEAATSGGTVKLPAVPGLDAFRGPLDG